jgi:hypothetical protein
MDLRSDGCVGHYLLNLQVLWHPERQNNGFDPHDAINND